MRVRFIEKFGIERQQIVEGENWEIIYRLAKDCFNEKSLMKIMDRNYYDTEVIETDKYN